MKSEFNCPKCTYIGPASTTCGACGYRLCVTCGVEHVEQGCEEADIRLRDYQQHAIESVLQQLGETKGDGDE